MHYGRKAPGSVVGPWGRCVTRVPGKPYAILSRCTGGTDVSWRRVGPSRQLRSTAGEPACLRVAERRSARQPLSVGSCEEGPRSALSLVNPPGGPWAIAA